MLFSAALSNGRVTAVSDTMVRDDDVVVPVTVTREGETVRLLAWLSSSDYKSLRNEISCVCRNCGKVKAGDLAYVHFNKNIGAAFRRYEYTAKGWFCRSCTRKLFANYMATCLFLGWWGIISFVTNPFRILLNLWQYVRAEIEFGGIGRFVVCAVVLGLIAWPTALLASSYVSGQPLRDLQSLATEEAPRTRQVLMSAAGTPVVFSQPAARPSALVVWSDSGDLCIGVQNLIPRSYWPSGHGDITYLVGVARTSTPQGKYGSTTSRTIDSFRVDYALQLVSYDGTPRRRDVIQGKDTPDSVQVPVGSTEPYYGDPPSDSTVASWVMTVLGLRY